MPIYICYAGKMDLIAAITWHMLITNFPLKSDGDFKFRDDEPEGLSCGSGLSAQLSGSVALENFTCSPPLILPILFFLPKNHIYSLCFLFILISLLDPQANHHKQTVFIQLLLLVGTSDPSLRTLPSPLKSSLVYISSVELLTNWVAQMIFKGCDSNHSNFTPNFFYFPSVWNFISLFVSESFCVSFFFFTSIQDEHCFIHVPWSFFSLILLRTCSEKLNKDFYCSKLQEFPNIISIQVTSILSARFCMEILLFNRPINASKMQLFFIKQPLYISHTTSRLFFLFIYFQKQSGQKKYVRGSQLFFLCILPWALENPKVWLTNSHDVADIDFGKMAVSGRYSPNACSGSRTAKFAVANSQGKKTMSQPTHSLYITPTKPKPQYHTTHTPNLRMLDFNHMAMKRKGNMTEVSRVLMDSGRMRLKALPCMVGSLCQRYHPIQVKAIFLYCSWSSRCLKKCIKYRDWRESFSRCRDSSFSINDFPLMGLNRAWLVVWAFYFLVVTTGSEPSHG
ncbi:hypothetical protein VP01_491g2 [Puccinia sorghi]|uniref:Uncharacterized protein n=1 Tax=Puccinia sorghi TaxID=27349 RepID=A0A0L6UM35_9BASI|nr:hypothetical protein VP01_491g2 [Puccinia sorghi]